LYFFFEDPIYTISASPIFDHAPSSDTDIQDQVDWLSLVDGSSKTINTLSLIGIQHYYNHIDPIKLMRINDSCNRMA